MNQQPFQKWEETTNQLLRSFDALYGKLDEAFSSADKTFTARAQKVPDPLRTLLEECNADVHRNYNLAKQQEGLLRKQIAGQRSALKDMLIGEQTDTNDPLISLIAQAGDLSMTAQLITEITKRGLDGLYLCILLEVLLGHDEATAFEVGAKKELIGALGDPGSGVITLLKRLHAVATRTLRTDQDAGKLLVSLGEFKSLMHNWRKVNVAMSEGQPFDHALTGAFGNTQ